jgi:hypothetical protein
MRSNRALLRALGLILVTVLAVALAACGDDGGDDPEPTTTTEEEETTDDSTAEEEEDEDVFQGGGDDDDEGDDDEEMGGGGDEQSTFADDIEEQVEAQIDVPPGEPYTDFAYVDNDDFSLEVSVPVEWSDVNGQTIDTEDEVGPQVSASTDLDEFFSNFDVPGMTFHASFVAALDTSQAAESPNYTYPDSCDYLPTEPLELEDDYYFGHVAIGLDCAGTTTDFVTIAADRDGGSNAVVILQVQLVTDADLEALSEILSTFLVSAPG